MHRKSDDVPEDLPSSGRAAPTSTAPPHSELLPDECGSDDAAMICLLDDMLAQWRGLGRVAMARWQARLACTSLGPSARGAATIPFVLVKKCVMNLTEFISECHSIIEAGPSKIIGLIPAVLGASAQAELSASYSRALFGHCC